MTASKSTKSPRHIVDWEARAREALFVALSAWDIGAGTIDDVREAWREFRRTRRPGTLYSDRHP